MTPERLAQIHLDLGDMRKERAAYRGCPAFLLEQTLPEELLIAFEIERARLDTLATLRPGELFDSLSDPRGLRAVLDERIAERAKGARG